MILYPRSSSVYSEEAALTSTFPSEIYRIQRFYSDWSQTRERSEKSEAREILKYLRVWEFFRRVSRLTLFPLLSFGLFLPSFRLYSRAFLRRCRARFHPRNARTEHERKNVKKYRRPPPPLPRGSQRSFPSREQKRTGTMRETRAAVPRIVQRDTETV